MSFCRKSVHSFLDLTNLNCNNNYYSSSLFESKLSSPTSSTTTTTCKHGLGLITDDETGSPQPNFKESSVVKLLQEPAVVMGVFQAKKDPGGIGFIDEVGGGVDGLMSCTESLGFESSDERTVDDGIELGTMVEESSLPSQSPSPSTTTTRANWRKEVKKFPPPLSSFNHHGQPSFFLLPVRKNGRLELTEVRNDRPEILRSYREDGRLRLHLIRDDDFDDEFKEEEEEQQNNNQEIQQQQQQQQQEKQENNEEEEEEEEEIEDEELMEEDNEEEETVDDWKFSVTGEGFRRCNEKPHHDHHRHHHHPHHHNMSHHHNLHVWGQHYVTTR